MTQPVMIGLNGEVEQVEPRVARNLEPDVEQLGTHRIRAVTKIGHEKSWIPREENASIVGMMDGRDELSF